MELPLPVGTAAVERPIAAAVAAASSTFSLISGSSGCADGDADEVALQDIGEVHRHASRARSPRSARRRLSFTPRGGRRLRSSCAHIRRGAQLAALLELLAGDPRASLDPDAVRAALAWEPRPVHAAYRGRSSASPASC